MKLGRADWMARRDGPGLGSARNDTMMRQGRAGAAALVIVFRSSRDIRRYDAAGG